VHQSYCCTWMYWKLARLFGTRQHALVWQIKNDKCDMERRSHLNEAKVKDHFRQHCDLSVCKYGHHYFHPNYSETRTTSERQCTKINHVSLHPVVVLHKYTNQTPCISHFMKFKIIYWQHNLIRQEYYMTYLHSTFSVLYTHF
jgi:hypothetical protein